MDSGSPDKHSADIGYLQEDDGSTFVGTLDLNLAVNKEGVECHDHENESWGDRIEAEGNQQEHHGSSSLHADVEHERPSSSYDKSNSQVDSKSDHDEEKGTDFEFDREQSYSYLGGNETGIGRSYKSNSPVDAESFHRELEVGDPTQLPLNFPVVDYMNVQELPDNMKEDKSPLYEDLDGNSGKFSENLQYEKTESAYEAMEMGGTEYLTGKSDDCNGAEKDIDYLGKSPYDCREIDGRTSDAYLSGRTRKRSSSPVREVSVSPERGLEIQPAVDRKLSLAPQGLDFSYSSPRMFRQNLPPSPDRPGGDSKRDRSQDHPSLFAMQTSASPSRRSRRNSPHRDDPILKSTSPRRRHLSPDRRRHERSISRSPTRRRDPPYGHRRDYRDRSRSRSPNATDRYRRSPRRYSPRRRSPPGYHSRRRSPRRRPWSPPRNRNNGIGRPGNNLFVAGFSFVTTERDLERKFSRFGRVRDVRIVRDKRSGDSRGFGFLSLERDEDADAAIRALDQTEWNGRVVLVEKSKSR